MATARDTHAPIARSFRGRKSSAKSRVALAAAAGCVETVALLPDSIPASTAINVYGNLALGSATVIVGLELGPAV